MERTGRGEKNGCRGWEQEMNEGWKNRKGNRRDRMTRKIEEQNRSAERNW